MLNRQGIVKVLDFGLAKVLGAERKTQAGVRVGSSFYMTPLFLVMVMIETSDVLFALDSIPAVLAITRDSFIAYTSNVFAVLGLRSLFFLLAPWFTLMNRLKIGLGAILLFIGVKMLISAFFPIPLLVSLAVIATILGISVLYSVLRVRNE
jgi:tellurite resistance protein TerC